MFERKIQPKEVQEALEKGKVIEDYPEDTPFPSCLLLGWIRGQPLHLMVALDEASKTCYIVTVYHPESELWDSDFRTRRPL